MTRWTKLHLSFLNGNIALLRYVRAVQELTDILFLHQTGLVNESTRSANVLHVDSRDLDLILHISGLFHSYVTHKVHNPTSLFTQKVSNFQLMSVLINHSGDGKMCVHVSHLVFETLGDTNEHVVDVAAQRFYGREVFLPTEPDFEVHTWSRFPFLGCNCALGNVNGLVKLAG